MADNAFEWLLNRLVIIDPRTLSVVLPEYVNMSVAAHERCIHVRSLLMSAYAYPKVL